MAVWEERGNHRGNQPEDWPAGDRADGKMEAERGGPWNRTGGAHDESIHAAEKRFPCNDLFRCFLLIFRGVFTPDESEVSLFSLAL